MKMNDEKKLTPVFWWLICGTILIILMVLVGGAVRLTNSGLSIVEWKPISGIIPPLNQEEWQKAFDSYKNIPEFQIENRHFTLEEFKNIYLWEYFHRLIARIIGLVFIIPFLFFWIKGYFRKKGLFLKVLLIFVFALFQAWLGWYMVQSGFTKLTDVSHFRLAIHLLYATLLASYVLWVALDIRHPDTELNWKSKSFKFTLVSLILFAVQLLYGAFTAGLNAGYYFRDYPKMGGEWVPSLGINSLNEKGIISLFSDPVMVYFIHRWWGIVVLLWLIFYVIHGVKHSEVKWMKNIYKLIFALVCLQVILGILTVLSGIEISLALFHQVNGIISFLSLVTILYFNIVIPQKSIKNVN